MLDYPVSAAVLLLPAAGTVCHGLITMPYRARIDGHRCYRMIYAGCVWTVLTSRYSAVASDPLAFREDGYLFLPLQPLDEFKTFTGFAAERKRHPVRAKDRPAAP